MLIEEIDPVGLETLQRVLDDLTNVLWATIRSCAAPAVEDEAELRGDRDLVPLSLQAATEEFLVGEGTVSFGGVEKGAAEFDGPINCGGGFHVIVRTARTVGMTHAHAAETDGGHFESLSTERACWKHRCTLLLAVIDDKYRFGVCVHHMSQSKGSECIELADHCLILHKRFDERTKMSIMLKRK